AGEGLLSLDDRVSDVLAEWVPEDPSPMLSELTMRSLLTMSAGFRRDPLPHRHSDSFSEDWAGICLGAPFEKRPGTSFYYQNAPTYLISRSIEKRAGETLLKYLKPRLFDPLGIPNPQWFECPNGHTSAFSGLFLTPEEMADIGELCLQNGSWRGKQLVPEEYMKEATSFQIDNRENRLTHEKDDTSGYGYFFWIGSEPGLSYASGVYGQQIYIFRELDAVISVTADIEEGDANQILLDLIREHLIPNLPE
ncbi:MAG: beta-lactamase family protein, partial [Lachnospiraceae bacterium]|nr:beta-lactamase family protein [Lachnospiraceae bacterium]